MSREFKVRTWLWVVLATVIVLGGGFTYWYVYGSKGTVSTKTSPTPTKSAVSSPGTSPAAGTTSTPAPGKTSTPTNGNQTLTIETETWEGKLASYCGDLDLSLRYPTDYTVNQSADYKYSINVWKLDTNGTVAPGNTKVSIQAAFSDDACSKYQTFQTPRDYYDYIRSLKPANGTYVTEEPTEFTINGMPAIKFGFAYGPGAPTSERYAFIRKSNKEFLEIYSSDVSNNDVYNTIIESINF